MRGKPFGPGNPGKPQGAARNRLALRVFEDVLAHWCEPVSPGSQICKGQAALNAVHHEKPADYLRFAGALLPKELSIEKATAGMTVADWDETIAKIREVLHARQQFEHLEKTEQVH
jgi:hypothetical protein